MNHPSAAMRALLAMAAIGVGIVPGDNASLGPEPARAPRRPMVGGEPYLSAPSLPHVPTRAELLAIEKRKRKAAKRLAEKALRAGKAGG